MPKIIKIEKNQPITVNYNIGVVLLHFYEKKYLIYKLKQRFTLPPDCNWQLPRLNVNHLFFDCEVAKCMWNTLSESLNIELTSTYECVAGKSSYANKGNQKQLAVG
jgi:hypothetical protein